MPEIRSPARASTEVRGDRRADSAGPPCGTARRARAHPPSARARLPSAASGDLPRGRAAVAWDAPHQVSERTSGQASGGHPVAGIAARPAEAGSRVHTDRGAPVPGHAEHSAPGVIDPGLDRRGEHPAQDPAELGYGRRRDRAVVIYPRAEAVGNAPPAERDPAVGVRCA